MSFGKPHQQVDDGGDEQQYRAEEVRADDGAAEAGDADVEVGTGGVGPVGLQDERRSQEARPIR